MFRCWYALVLLALQLLPALALVPGQAAALSRQVAHALVHQSGQGHHHDNALAVQIDDDNGGAGLAHAHPDAGQPSALPLTISDQRLLSAEDSAPLHFRGVQWPIPHLDRPLRPPRAPA